MHNSSKQKTQRQSWTPMHMQAMGTVADIVRAGGGKLTPPFDDPGEPRKPKGQE